MSAAALALGSTVTVNAANLVNIGTGADGAGELFIGFHATGGTGSGKSVVIDVGAVSVLAAKPAGSVVNLGNIGTDLTTAFSDTTSWYNRTDVLWSAVSAVQSTVPSTSSDPTSTLYGSVSGTGAFPLTTTAYTRGSNSAQNPVAQKVISNMATGTGGFTAAAQGSTSNIAIELSGEANNYATWMPGGTNTSLFGGFAGQTTFEQAFTIGQISPGVEGSLDVYRMYRTNGTSFGSPPFTDPDNGLTSGPGSYQFTLQVDQSGNLTATVLPVPEPASIGLLMTGSLVFLGYRRRGTAGRLQAMSAS